MAQIQVKIFTDNGAAGIARVERDINAWLNHLPPNAAVMRSETALCAVADESDGGHYQSIAISVWYFMPSN